MSEYEHENGPMEAKCCSPMRKSFPPIPYERRKALLDLSVQLTSIMLAKAERHEMRLLNQMMLSLLPCKVDY